MAQYTSIVSVANLRLERILAPLSFILRERADHQMETQKGYYDRHHDQEDFVDHNQPVKRGRLQAAG